MVHDHQHDPNYDNVILHVVWKHDRDIANGIPVLELDGRVSRLLLKKYESLMQAGNFIPCESSIAIVDELAIKSWKERLLVERLIRKSNVIEDFCRQNGFHWEETFWWMLARNFGMKVNSEAFEQMARSVKVEILTKHKHQINQIEALLFGQAGLLNRDFEDAYPRMLQKEYRFLKKKYNLCQGANGVFFLRMRPTNFPTIRLAQLAMLIHRSTKLFSGVLESEDVGQLKSLMDITANDYWHYHYRFDEPSGFKNKKLGEEMAYNLVINTIAPILFAYGHYKGETKYKEKALRWLEQIPAESNSIIRGFLKTGLKVKDAFDSQSLLELKSRYCDVRRCLECSIGVALLKEKKWLDLPS